MIDTDKYEGHTEGPWAYREDEVYAEGNPCIVALRAHGTDGELTSKLPHRWADFALITAAPDLLAEVKRLRKQLAYDSKVYHEMSEEGIMAWNNAECRLAGEEEMFGEVD